MEGNASIGETIPECEFTTNDSDIGGIRKKEIEREIGLRDLEGSKYI